MAQVVSQSRGPLTARGPRSGSGWLALSKLIFLGRVRKHWAGSGLGMNFLDSGWRGRGKRQ